MNHEGPFHEGELRVQERAGERGRAALTGTIIGARIPAGAIRFLGDRSMLVVATMDPPGRLRASLLFGPPGFVTAPSDRSLRVDTGGAVVTAPAPVLADLGEGASVGLLAIDLPSRRRLRINGRVAAIDRQAVGIAVDEAYANCPQYITPRHLTRVSDGHVGGGGTRRGTLLDAAVSESLERADTLFVASAHPQRGLDASHRGGARGFVRVLDDSTVRVADFVGNSMFNTLGNFEVYPQAGIVVPDFDGGRVVQLMGRPEIRWDDPDPEGKTGGTRRFWDLHVAEWLSADLPVASTG